MTPILRGLIWFCPLCEAEVHCPPPPSNYIPGHGYPPNMVAEQNEVIGRHWYTHSRWERFKFWAIGGKSERITRQE